MSTTFLPTTAEISALFATEIAALGGAVSDDRYDDGQRLFVRAVLPPVQPVRPGDAVNGGVALRVAERVVAVHPYTFRQVCANGAIVSQARRGRQLSRVELASATEFVTAALDEIRLTIRACASDDAFTAAVDEMRSASAMAVEDAIALMPMLRRASDAIREHLFAHIVSRYEREGDRSAYGLMNAVTAVARDTRDPEEKWRLEELGGSVPALVRLAPRVPGGREVLAGV